MSGLFQRLTDPDLLEVARALRSGRLSAPFTTIALERVVPNSVATDVAADLDLLSQKGFGAEQVASTLELLRLDRQSRPRVEDILDLVTTGPEVPGIANRDTSVVVRELFANAQDSVLVA